jgi:hypothetical protein
MTILTGVYYYLGITFVTKKRHRLMCLHDKGEQRIYQAVNCLFFVQMNAGPGMAETGSGRP